MSIELSKGSNTAITADAVAVAITWNPGSPVDVDASVLLLGASGKVGDDDDFVFYNNPRHRSSAVSHTGKTAGRDTLEVTLSKVETEVRTLVLAASADGGTFGQVTDLRLSLTDARSGSELATFAMTAHNETAFVAGEIYRRDGQWKLRAIAQGYSSGLAGLAMDYGISVDDAPDALVPPAASSPTVTAPAIAAEAAPPPAAAISLKKQKLISMEKQLQTRAPGMLSLTKTAAVSLEKKGLGEHTARVALCLDISGSMNGLYRAGKIQLLAERALALGLRFDDDGEVDVFLFGTGGYTADAINVGNFTGYTDSMLRLHKLEGGTRYATAMALIREHYFGSSAPRDSVHPDKLPVYVMFITDGATSDERATIEQVQSSSFEPLFWQFMAIGTSSRSVDAPPVTGRFAKLRAAASDGGEFRFLEQLDDMPGRYLDNADFFAVSDPAALSDGQLFDLLMTEYPQWLKQARVKGLLRD